MVDNPIPEWQFRWAEGSENAILQAMQYHVRNAQNEGTENSDAPFKIFIAYDSDSARDQAMETFNFVIRELGEEIPVGQTSWNVRSNDCQTERKILALEAAAADLVIIAVSPSADVESEINDWVGQWTRQRADNGGMLAVIPGDAPAQVDFLENLREAAISAGMDFLCRNTLLRKV